MKLHSGIPLRQRQQHFRKQRSGCSETGRRHWSCRGTLCGSWTTLNEEATAAAAAAAA
eukprot:CAMPEP_0177749288 /NCGR_PEP_ID=MMETSP0484_2-20121128/32404_1 /TAXON_ID=354590 /ORGANISM="Rhodomonas lens, Strain RHODO" /LENGTH=57 /DNA_ID=CAMNT_0019264257 /DNA_START=109 /DNA_END=279 /DNA_ORIENTATION=-